MHPFYMEQLVQELKSQSEQLRKMERLLDDLRKDVDRLMLKKETNIERIDYHFDLLKIEKLEGTLNIGMTQNGAKSLEDMVVNGQPLNQLQTDPKRAAHIIAIQESVNAYLNDEVPGIIEKIAMAQANYVEENDIKTIIQDMKNQVDARIVLYLDQIYKNADDSMSDNEVESTVIQKVKRDINTAIQNYFEKKNAGKQGPYETERNE